jgi:hypothetical protein
MCAPKKSGTSAVPGQVRQRFRPASPYQPLGGLGGAPGFLSGLFVLGLVGVGWVGCGLPLDDMASSLVGAVTTKLDMNVRFAFGHSGSNGQSASSITPAGNGHISPFNIVRKVIGAPQRLQVNAC